MIWAPDFKRGPRGRLFGFLFGKIGERIFNKYARDVLKNLEKLEGELPWLGFSVSPVDRSDPGCPGAAP